MTTSVLSKTDSDFRELERQREKTKEELVHLHKDLAGVPARSDAEKERIGMKIRDLTANLQASQGTFESAKRKARAAAGQALATDKGYGALVTAAAVAWATRLGPLVALYQRQREARRGGVEVPAPLPPIATSEIEQAIGWLNLCIKRDLLDPKALPAALRSLVGEG